MTTVTANDLVTEEKLRFIAREPSHVEQRRMYERLPAGQLRCTRAEMRRAAIAPDPRPLAPAVPAKPEPMPLPVEVSSMASAAG